MPQSPDRIHAINSNADQSPLRIRITHLRRALPSGIKNSEKFTTAHFDQNSAAATPSIQREIQSDFVGGARSVRPTRPPKRSRHLRPANIASESKVGQKRSRNPNETNNFQTPHRNRDVAKTYLDSNQQLPDSTKIDGGIHPFIPLVLLRGFVPPGPTRLSSGVPIRSLAATSCKVISWPSDRPPLSSTAQDPVTAQDR